MGAAGDELARLAALGELHDEAPRWLADKQHEQGDAYLVIADVVLPLKRCGWGMCAVTCIPHGGISSRAREARRATRRRRGGRRTPRGRGPRLLETA